METTDKRREIAEAARHQLEGTFASVKTRLHPKALSREMVARAKAKARDTAEDAANAVKARPALVAGVVAAATFILFRAPLKSVAKRLLKEKNGG
jgi:hypothetical protein